MIKIKTLIIDDEPLARAMLRELLGNESEIEVMAECGDGFAGLKAIQDLKPDLIFLDIQMPKITGFELLELLESPPHIIFTTAYDEFALKAFDVNALDYLMKPINPDRLKIALKRVADVKLTTSTKLETLKTEIIPTEYLQRIVVKTNDKIQILPLKEIYYIESANDYIKIHNKDQYFLKLQTMSYCEMQLPPDLFVRIHRSYLVNISHIHKIELYEKDQYCAILRNDEKLSISKSGYGKLKGILRL